jgi:hypothetical protein
MYRKISPDIPSSISALLLAPIIHFPAFDDDHVGKVLQRLDRVRIIRRRTDDRDPLLTFIRDLPRDRIAISVYVN